ncbi:MAG: menaquinone biosynthesis protein [Candidatus Omnitrophica bacterium]|nr:menaquinone biosynthesis protein [Candidatus Omnitrophota bacterium]
MNPRNVMPYTKPFTETALTSTAGLLRLGRIPYLNSEPFFAFLSESAAQCVDLVPRDLGMAAGRGEIDAGLMAVADWFRLDKSFRPLGPWGIAVPRKALSVFLLTKQPLKELNRGVISVTDESSTSFALARILLRQKYGLRVSYRRGAYKGALGRLVIGDEALRIAAAPPKGWELVDLGEEWFEWTGLPFVFAHWVVRVTVPEKTVVLLSGLMETALHRGMAGLSEIAERRSNDLGLTQEQALQYLQNFVYELGPQEEIALGVFRKLCSEL